MTVRLTQASAPLMHSIDVRDEFGATRRIAIPAERALTVFVDKRELVTLMTLGAAPELLVLGYLRNQRLVERADDIDSITVDWDVQAAAVTTRAGIERFDEKTAKRVVTTGCGQGTVFGDLMDDLDRIALPPAYGPPVQSVAPPPAGDVVATGEYLARIGHCMDCHTPRTTDGRLLMEQLGAGGMQFPGPWGVSVARNLTPHDSGLKGWSDAEIARAIRTGVGRDGSTLKPPMGFAYYRNIGDADMAALVAYLRSLKPQPFAGRN